MIKIEVDSTKDDTTDCTFLLKGDLENITADILLGIRQIYSVFNSADPEMAVAFKAAIIRCSANPNSAMWTLEQKDSAADAGTSTTERMTIKFTPLF